jgi:glutamyl-tRNA synthetase
MNEHCTPKIVGRLAPSPTGAQHLGNARTYLIAWLNARSHGGRVILRIEDIDTERNKPAATEQTYEDLRWLGLDWDGEPIIQSGRIEVHREALLRLREGNLVYPCTCTRADIERASSAPHPEHEGPIYPGLCAHRQATDSDQLDREDRYYCWRYRVPQQSPAFVDGFLGETQFDLRIVGGDFIVWKSARSRASFPAYQLAVVVDDAESHVTEVIRGDDLISSTPRQLLLYRDLGLTAPTFIHVPMVVDVNGRRLAKRNGDTRLSSLRSAGVAASKVRGLLAWSCGWIETIREVEMAELLEKFTLATIPRQAFVLRPEYLEEIGYRG